MEEEIMKNKTGAVWGKRPWRRLVFCLLLSSPLVWGIGLLSAEEGDPSIGTVIAVKERVYVLRAGREARLPVQRGDDILFADTYETGAGAKAKLLFQDDSLVTLGEHTRLRITESVYEPAKKQRSSLMELLSGSARALVGKSFSGAKSKFEIHTPTTVAAAKGTYFIVRFYEQEWLSEVFNLSRTSKLEVFNKDLKAPQPLEVKPHEIARLKRGEALRVLTQNDPEFTTILNRALTETKMKESPDEGSLEAGLKAPTAAQIATFEFDANLPGDDCGRGILPHLRHLLATSTASLLGQCENVAQIFQQIPPLSESGGGSGASTGVSLGLNFQ